MKKQVRKKSSKIDRWQGQMDERTLQLVKTTDELKEAVGKLHDKFDSKLEEIKTCVDNKFEKHNMHHEYVEKKYTKLFLVLGTLALASCILNPESLKVLWSLIVKLIGIF